ncbi:MAG: elongation factor P lysine(34) lysyltransferase [Legionella sp.]|nr:MAG: elongation factor P lysine(34) lysyltransferase [Legionella sp.]PJD99908.1 MAG: elongation factor P lysine(34) lysyltransferase [Legionella sp.]
MSALWRPSADLETLRQRALLIQKIRAFFIERAYLEVETPAMAHYGISDPYLTNIHASFRRQAYALQTSPEYHMKRLLAAGSGPIFQLARVFRDDELGRWHNPEFTLLEWYQLDVDHHELMIEIDLFLQQLLQTPPLFKMTYQNLFQEACGLDPFTGSLHQLRDAVARYDLAYVLDAEEQDPDQYLFLLMSHVAEPWLAQQDRPVAVYDFPPSQASLAQVHEGVAHRFEIYYRGIELANGFHELCDAHLQAQRFRQDNVLRQRLGLASVPPDPWLLDALAHGLPACSGVALGVDRLLMLALNKAAISEVLAFTVERA